MRVVHVVTIYFVLVTIIAAASLNCLREREREREVDRWTVGLVGFNIDVSQGLLKESY